MKFACSQELLIEIDTIIKKLRERYYKDKRLILTEGDMINHAHTMLIRANIPEKYNLSLHSELRPFDASTYEFIRDNGWSKDVPINYAVKFDLSLIDKSKDYWDVTYRRVAQAQTGHENKVKYWRFLLYPSEAFKAVIEFKIRVNNNLKNLKKDIKKLYWLHMRNKECLKFIVIMDRKATERCINNIQRALNNKEFIHSCLVGSKEVELASRTL